MSNEMLVTASHTPAVVPSRSSMPTKKFATLRCSISTPFGRPVDPDVKIMYARLLAVAVLLTFSARVPDCSSPESSTSISGCGSGNASCSDRCVRITRGAQSSSIMVMRAAG